MDVQTLLILAGSQIPLDRVDGCFSSSPLTGAVCNWSDLVQRAQDYVAGCHLQNGVTIDVNYNYIYHTEDCPHCQPDDVTGF